MIDVLTWTFRSAFFAGAASGAAFVLAYHLRTGGAWRRRPAGVTLMGMVAALTLAFLAVTARVFTRPDPGEHPGAADLIILSAAAVAVWAVVAFILHRLYLLWKYWRPDDETEQH